MGYSPHYLLFGYHLRFPIDLHFPTIQKRCMVHVNDDRYHVPKFPHSSATFNIISGFRILASPIVLQGAFGNSTCPMRHSQPCPMLANRHLTGLTWFPIVLYYIK